MSASTATRTASALRPRLLGRSVVNLVVFVSVLYTLLPVLWLVLASAKNRDALFSSNILSLSDFSFVQNMKDLFAMDGGLYGRWYGNSLLYAVLGAALGSLISVACGYAFDKYRFAHKEKLFGLVLAAVMVPQTVLALPLYLMASGAGLVNTFWAVFIPVLFNPFGVYLGRIFSQGTYPTRCWRPRGWTARVNWPPTSGWRCACSGRGWSPSSSSSSPPSGTTSSCPW